ncbi:MAG: zinc ribbon domain-containing protein [Candidatus Eisenbacteria bacterium]|nr:zinc ribbon domain-containing protein [Candidatus Eisenbacteria bacterium]
MPTYDYRCKECGKSFSVSMTIKEHDRRRPKCPKCSSSKVQQKISIFHAITSKKS